MGLWSSVCCNNSVHPWHQFTNSQNMTCESCGLRFSFLKKKKKCQECLKDFCSGCIRRESGFVAQHLLCRTCHTLTIMPLDRLELMQLRVRELQQFLVSKNIPVHSCTEKRDLVDLVIRYAARRNSTPTSSPHRSAPPNNHQSSTQQTRTATTTTTNVNVSPAANTTTSTTTTTTTTQENNPHNSTPPPVSRQEGLDLPGSNDPCQKTASSLQVTETGGVDKKLRVEDVLDVDVEQLSIRQLKEILSRSFVTYRGCCEKGELVSKVKQLQEEVRANNYRVMQGLPEENTCKICMDALIDCVLLECGHMVSCTKCGQLLSECPVCRQYVVRVVHTFRA